MVLWLSHICKAGLQNQNKTQKTNPTAGKRLLTLDTLAVNSWYSRSSEEDMGNFKKRTKPSSVPVIWMSDFSRVMSQQGRTWAWMWPRPSLSAGRASRCHLAAVPSPWKRTSRGIQAVWGAFMRKTCWVGLGEDNYWQWCAMKWQDESRILRALNLKWFFFS